MKIRPGWLNQRITIQSRATGQDDIGQPVVSWGDVCSVRASVMDVSGREYVAAGGEKNSAQTKILIRHRNGITPTMRVLCKSVVYNIEAVLEQDSWALLLMCRRSV